MKNNSIKSLYELFKSNFLSINCLNLFFYFLVGESMK